MTTPLAVDATGNELLAYETCDEADLAVADATVPLPLALVVATVEGTDVAPAGIVLVLNRFRGEWELPGGMIEAGESPREAASREYLEETGHRAGGVQLAGVALFRLMPDHRLERAAVFRATAQVTESTEFEPTEEIAQLCTWREEQLEGLSALDVSIARLVSGLPTA
jgi:8-oxo-dGTP pyrophosphatase MutT (NUDIX family)